MSTVIKVPLHPYEVMDCSQTQLPVEVLDQIIQHTIPDANYLAYPASHPITKTLFSLLAVCKATSHTAKILLHTQCLYIDAPWRLDSLVTKSLSTSNCSIPLTRIKRLYLSPFSSRTIRERKVVDQITGLFNLLSPSLKRLIIDMPLRSHYPQEDVNEKLRPILRQGFEQLVNLEEFSSVRDDLFLSFWDPAFYHIQNPDIDHEHWITDHMFGNYTELKYLALSHCDMGPAFMTALKNLPLLEKVVVSRPWPQLYTERFWPGREGRFFGARIGFVVVQATGCVDEVGMTKMGMEMEMEEGIENVSVDERPNACKYLLFVEKDEDEISTLQKWSLERMLSGEIWSLTDPVESNPSDKLSTTI